MRILGIDPGLDGALALIDGNDLVVIEDMPTIAAKKRRQINEVELARIIDALLISRVNAAFLELVGIRPGEGPVGAFAFGRGYGLLRGILRAHFVPLYDVPPAVWKRAVGIPAGAGKDSSRALATELWQRKAELFRRVKDDGRADAALIARYGRLSGKVTA